MPREFEVNRNESIVLSWPIQHMPRMLIDGKIYVPREVQKVEFFARVDKVNDGIFLNLQSNLLVETDSHHRTATDSTLASPPPNKPSLPETTSAAMDSCQQDRCSTPRSSQFPPNPERSAPAAQKIPVRERTFVLKCASAAEYHSLQNAQVMWRCRQRTSKLPRRQPVTARTSFAARLSLWVSKRAARIREFFRTHQPSSDTTHQETF